MKRDREAALRGTGPAMTRPLLWSAAGHLLALSACIVLGAGGGPGARFAPVVEVLLVAGDSAPGGAPASAAAQAGPPLRAGGYAGPLRNADAPPRLPVDRAPSGAPVRPAFPPAALPAAAPAPASADPAPRPAPRPVVVVPAARVDAGPAPGAAAAAAVAASEGALRGAPVASGGDPAGAGGTGSVKAGPPPQAGAADGGGAGGAAGLLRERIQSRIVYPAEAQRQGLEGDVLLRIHIEIGGVPNEIRIARTSGTRILDAAARRGVVDASPLPSGPGWVEVPVRFRLQ